MAVATEFPGANLAAFLNWSGEKPHEIEAELLRIVFQVKELTPYDRVNGGSLENMEQTKFSDSAILLFIVGILESIYRMNEERGFDPYVVVGYSDIRSQAQSKQLLLTLTYRLLSDAKKTRDVKVSI